MCPFHRWRKREPEGNESSYWKSVLVPKLLITTTTLACRYKIPDCSLAFSLLKFRGVLSRYTPNTELVSFFLSPSPLSPITAPSFLPPGAFGFLSLLLAHACCFPLPPIQFFLTAGLATRTLKNHTKNTLSFWVVPSCPLHSILEETVAWKSGSSTGSTSH